MPRSVPEWVGESDDTPIPPRVRVRVFLRFDGICRECYTKILSKDWICDHRTALINGGENRESNLGPIHARCNKVKTRSDVDLKSKTYQKRTKWLGIKVKKYRPLAGTKASGWKHKLDGTWVKRTV